MHAVRCCLDESLASLATKMGAGGGEITWGFCWHSSFSRVIVDRYFVSIGVSALIVSPKKCKAQHVHAILAFPLHHSPRVSMSLLGSVVEYIY